MVGRELLGALRGPACWLILLTLAGCAGGGTKPAALPPVSEVAAEAPKPKTTGEEPVAAPLPPTVVVIDDGAAVQEKGPKSLAEAAREERERRAQASKPVAVIDNQNLAEFSRGQKLTVADEANSSAAPAASASTAVAQATRDEAFWRNRGLMIRRQWREAFDQISELETKAGELRQRFYAADDPYLRDSQIKPEWDHALEELEAARREVERSEIDLERFLEEGRRAGAFPGWLREGAELEPEHTPRKASAAEASDTVEAPQAQDPP